PQREDLPHACHEEDEPQHETCEEQRPRAISEVHAPLYSIRAAYAQAGRPAEVNSQSKLLRRTTSLTLKPRSKMSCLPSGDQAKRKICSAVKLVNFVGAPPSSG